MIFNSAEHKFTKYSASTIAASSIAAAMSGLKWDLCTGHNIQFLLNLLTDLTSVGQVCIILYNNYFMIEKIALIELT